MTTFHSDQTPQRPATPLGKYIRIAIGEIMEAHRKMNSVPVCAPVDEIRDKAWNDVRLELHRMIKTGEVNYHRTINSVTFTIDPETEPEQ